MSKQDQPGKLWDGRFNEPTDSFVARFTQSVSFDKRLAHHDIRGSIAHATMLHRVALLSADEREQIVSGLELIDQQIDAGEFPWSADQEDVHMNIEAALTAAIGEPGKKLHTARSRNDQVATDMRLYLRDEIDEIRRLITAAQTQLTVLAEREADTIMPGFTHLQIAQPVTFGHHMMAWFEMLQRDYQRLTDCRARVNCMPLGAAALAGTDFPIDREITAELLGFEQICDNSLDAVSDRDFAVEFAASASLIMAHLSRWSEELILWMSAPFRFIDLPDRFCTGSSIMPQKKNPDVPELIRGKSGRVFGHLMGLLTLIKGQPLSYNRDNQEDKEPLFDTLDTVKDCLRAYVEMLPHVEVNPARMIEVARQGFATATDLADYLVKKGLAFRDAHEVVGKLVALAIREGCGLEDLSLEQMQAYSPEIGPDVFASLTLDGSVNARSHRGGTAPVQVRAAAARARALLAAR